MYRTTAFVQVALANGGAVQLAKGSDLPANVADGVVEHLVDMDFVELVEGDEPSGPPAKSASKGDWEAYARSQGATDEDLDGVTKDDLVATYGE